MRKDKCLKKLILTAFFAVSMMFVAAQPVQAQTMDECAALLDMFGGDYDLLALWYPACTSVPAPPYNPPILPPPPDPLPPPPNPEPIVTPDPPPPTKPPYCALIPWWDILFYPECWG